MALMKQKKQKLNSKLTKSTKKKRHLYEQYAEILQRLKAYGWRPFIPLAFTNGGGKEGTGMPRLLAEQAWDLHHEHNKAFEADENFEYLFSFSLPKDGHYIDSHEKWQKYVNDGSLIKDDIVVQFYKSNLILRLSISETISDIEIQTNSFYYFFSHPDDEETNRSEKWLEYLTADIPKWQAKHQEAEDILRAKGYTIDDSYEDAPRPKEYYEYVKQRLATN